MITTQSFSRLSLTKQNRSTEGCSKLKRSVDMTSSGKNCLDIRKMLVPNGTRPGVRRSKCPLLASRTGVRGWVRVLFRLAIFNLCPPTAFYFTMSTI